MLLRMLRSVAMCQIRRTVRLYGGVIPALVALWNVDPADPNAKEANSLCLKGLQYLTKCNSKIGDNPQAIVSALINLLKQGMCLQANNTVHQFEVNSLQITSASMF